MSNRTTKSNSTETTGTVAAPIAPEEKMINYITKQTVVDPNTNKLILKSVTVPVPLSLFKELYREPHTYQSKMQYHGRCKCPKDKRFTCDMDCYFCRYHRAGDTVPYGASDEDLLRPKYSSCAFENPESDTAENCTFTKEYSEKDQDSVYESTTEYHICSEEFTAEERDISNKRLLQEQTDCESKPKRKFNKVNNDLMIDNQSYCIEDFIEKSELIELERKYIAELTPDEQKICNNVMNDVSIRKAAKELNIPVSTYNSRKMRVFNKLRPKLEEFYYAC